MENHLIAWGITVLVITFIVGSIGVAINKHPLGILVDSRNRMSLSRMQMTLWTILLVSAFLVAAFTHHQ